MITRILLYFMIIHPVAVFSQGLWNNPSEIQPTVYLVGSIHNMHLDQKNHYSINDLLAQISALKPDLVCGEITPEAYNQPMEGYFPPEAAFLAEMADELNYRFVPVDWRLDYSTQTLAGKEVPSSINEQSAALVKSIFAKQEASNSQSLYDFLHAEATINDLDSLYEKIIGMNTLAEISSGSWHERNRRAVENGLTAAGNAHIIVFVFGIDHLPQLKHQLKSRGIDAHIPQRLFTPGNDHMVSTAVLKRWQRNLQNLELIRDKKIPVTYDNYQKVINSKRIEDLQAMIRQFNN